MARPKLLASAGILLTVSSRSPKSRQLSLDAHGILHGAVVSIAPMWIAKEAGFFKKNQAWI